MLAMASRRQWIISFAALSSAGVAGCLGSTGDGSGSDDDPSSNDPTDTTPVGQFQYDETNTGKREYTAPSSIDERWTFDLELEYRRRVPAGFAATDSLLLIVYGGGGILALDTDEGEPVWEREFPLNWSATPAVSGDTMYVPKAGPKVNHGLEANDLDDGSSRWEALEGVHVWAPPTLTDDNTVIVCGVADRLAAYGVDATTGDELWQHPLEAELDKFEDDGTWSREYQRSLFRIVAPAVDDGIVYVTGGQPPTLYALDIATGEERWAVTLAAESVGVPDDVTYHAPTVYDNAVYVGTKAGGVYAVSTSGDYRWAATPVADVTASLAVDTSGIYVPGEGTFSKLLFDTPETPEWTVEVHDGRQQPRSRTPTLTDDLVIGADDEVAWARTKDDGELIWSYQPESRSRGDVTYGGDPTDPILHDGVVYVTSNAARMYALG